MNLMRDQWRGLESRDIAVVVGDEFGSSCLYDDSTVAYPDEEQCRVLLRYDEDGQLVAIEPGPAFEQEQWDRIAGRIESELITATRAIGRNFSFGGYRVRGWWRSETLSVQILPPPIEAPSIPYEMGSHPFVLEFPFRKSSNTLLTNFRRNREHRQLTALLNVLLEGHVSSPWGNPRHLWAFLPDSESFETAWVQEGFICPGFQVEANTLSEPSGEPMEAVPAADYYSEYGYESWRGLQVPDILEASIQAYRSLSPANRDRLDRACYWYELKDKLWDLSQSAYYGALVTSVEALLQQPRGHGNCPECGRSLGPGPTRLFQEFLERYGPATGNVAEARTEIYGLRSAISHGDKLVRHDLDIEWSLNPATEGQRRIGSSAWQLIRVALVNWLHEKGGGPKPIVITLHHPGRMRTATVRTSGGETSEG